MVSVLTRPLIFLRIPMADDTFDLKCPVWKFNEKLSSIVNPRYFTNFDSVIGTSFMCTLLFSSRRGLNLKNLHLVGFNTRLFSLANSASNAESYSIRV